MSRRRRGCRPDRVEGPFRVVYALPSEDLLDHRRFDVAGSAWRVERFRQVVDARQPIGYREVRHVTVGGESTERSRTAVLGRRLETGIDVDRQLRYGVEGWNSVYDESASSFGCRAVSDVESAGLWPLNCRRGSSAFVISAFGAN